MHIAQCGSCSTRLTCQRPYIHFIRVVNLNVTDSRSSLRLRCIRY